MRRNAQNRKPIIITAVAVVLLAALVLIGAGSRRANFLENAIGAVVTPVQSFASRASGAVSDFFRNIFNTTDADEENARLRGELAMHNRSLLELEELRQENERLRALLNYSDSLSLGGGVTARVIGSSTGVYFRVFTVNAGRSSGVDLDMPVICADGLVGLVSEVGSNWCKVTAIIDSSMSVPIMVERTRDGCMARGVLNAVNSESRMELYYLRSDRTDLIPGDVIITSGIGGVYGKGIRVGTVTEVMTAAGSGVNAIITPSVDFMHLEEVMILTGEGGEG